MFRPTYLYVKTHRVTGKKYFGKTVENPLTYRGSGIHWRRHVRVHGPHVDTEILGFFTDKYSCILYAYAFSEMNDIVSSSIWLNLKFENGTDGGWDHVNSDKEAAFKKNVAAGKKAQLLNPNAKLNLKSGGGPKNTATLIARRGKEFFVALGSSYKRTDEIKKKNSLQQTGKRMVNNGAKNILVRKEELEQYLAKGWSRGNMKTKNSKRP